MSLIFGKRVFDLLNKLITEELMVAYTFLAMSSVLADMGLEGCSHWTEAQSEKRIWRSMRVYRHIRLRNGRVRFLQIPAPKQDWRAPLHIFEEIFKMEQRISSNIMSLYEFALGDKDYQTKEIIEWFIDDQMKNEAFVENLLGRFRKMQTTDLGVFMFDEEMERRTSQNSIKEIT
ncbi:MAG: ferritin [Holosporaceae bacterium]|nr:ferritin [Holosporaceae bacterium]